jgi:hypothetical protein
MTLAVMAVGLLSVPVLAHHSFAMFDGDISIEVEATVAELQWTNPHTWLELTVVAGDKITVVYHPMKDGTPEGQLLSMVLENGETYD